MSSISRRSFLTSAAAGAAGLALPGRAFGARVPHGEKVRIAIIGCGAMGRAHTYSLAHNEECDLRVLCDVFVPKYEEVAKNVETITQKRPDCYQDFRRVLERDDIDAVFVATPDHWHPLVSIYACQAGKDVYVEKPVCTTVAEGRAMVETARRYGRVMQVGTQQRSMPVFIEAIRRIREGDLGEITSATAWVGTNGSSVNESIQDVPEGMDWDLWLGPAPTAPYSPERYYGFRSFNDYARGGELTNWGVHLIDVLHWGIGQDRPLSVSALGGSYRGDAGSDNYETIEATLEYPGCTVTWEQRHVNAYSNKGYGMKFNGTNGRAEMDRGILTISRPDGGREEIIFPPEQSWADRNHHNNFFHCVRTRQKPVADIEQGHRSTTATLLAGIALRTGRTLEWDAEAERFIRDEQADRHLSRAYRAPWHL